MREQQIMRIYSQMSIADCERIGFPINYWNLTDDQKRFIAAIATFAKKEGGQQ